MKEINSAFFCQNTYNISLKEYGEWAKHMKLLKYKIVEDDVEFGFLNSESDDNPYSFSVASFNMHAI